MINDMPVAGCLSGVAYARIPPFDRDTWSYVKWSRLACTRSIKASEWQLLISLNIHADENNALEIAVWCLSRCVCAFSSCSFVRPFCSIKNDDMAGPILLRATTQTIRRLTCPLGATSHEIKFNNTRVCRMERNKKKIYIYTCILLFLCASMNANVAQMLDKMLFGRHFSRSVTLFAFVGSKSNSKYRRMTNDVNHAGPIDEWLGCWVCHRFESRHVRMATETTINCDSSAGSLEKI